MNAMWLRLAAMVGSAILSQMVIDSAMGYEEIMVVERRLFQPFNIADGGVFRQVVVYIEPNSRGKPFAAAKPPRIEAKGCRFLPLVNLERDDHDVVVVNINPAMHDIQAYETSQLGPRVLFNMP